jgi:hypothetical protein
MEALHEALREARLALNQVRGHANTFDQALQRVGLAVPVEEI